MNATRTIANQAVPAVGRWEIDPAHSDLRITARRLMVTEVRGTFRSFTGDINVAEDPRQSQVTVKADAASVYTGIADRDSHLRSVDFIDADTYPDVIFTSTDIQSEGQSWKMTGNLTIRGVSHPITFDISFEGSATDPYGNVKAAFVAEASIDRENWGLTWNVPIDGGGVLVSRQLEVSFDVQALLIKEDGSQ